MNNDIHSALQRLGGEWDYCEHCGAVGWRDYQFRVLHDIGECNNTGWRGVGEDILDHAREEVDYLNELEAIRLNGPNP